MRIIHTLICTTALLAASGCTAIPGDRPGSAAAPPPAAETLEIAVGPCFGFCPVYRASIDPAGKVHFEGERHTALLGARDTQIAPGHGAAVIASLASYRPATGTTAQTQCEQQISDQQHYTLSWTAPDGTRTVLEHDKGCRSPRNEVLNALIGALPEQIGIGEWARQVTRPGVSRG